MSFQTLKRFFGFGHGSDMDIDSMPQAPTATTDSEVEYLFTLKDGQPAPSTNIATTVSNEAKEDNSTEEKVRLPVELCGDPSLTP